jgi:hypothetical protein
MGGRCEPFTMPGITWRPPKAARERVEWQTAAETLILAAKGQRPLMFAQIAMLRALHAGDDAPAPKPRRKAPRKYRIVR